jgi:hypothetical protein
MLLPLGKRLTKRFRSIRTSCALQVMQCKQENILWEILLQFYAITKQETVLRTEVSYLRLANQETALRAERL